MKKIVFFLFSFSIIFLSGCTQKDLIDIYVFSDRFSKYSSNFEINTNEFSATEENGELIFPITFNDKFLITVYVNDKTSLITSVSVVYLFENNRSISDKDFSDFYELTQCSTKAFTNIETTSDIFLNLSLDKKNNLIKNSHTHFEKDFYKFSLVSNDVGIYFSVSTERR